MGQGVPAEARVTIGAVCAAGVLCAAPALRTAAPWPAIAALAVLYAVCEPGVVPERFTAGRTPFAAGPFVPALLAGALLLPPAAAALVAVPGSLAGRGVPWLRRCWRAGYLAVAAWTASLAAGLLGGRSAVRAADLPYAVLPAAVAALAQCAAGIALTGAVLVTAEHCRPGAAWLEPLPGALVPHLAYGMVGLTTALLWQRGCGVLAAVLVPLPMYAACRFFARARRVAAAHQATVRALVQAVDLKDPYTRGHSERVGRGSAMIARELGLPDERVDALRLAGILHDIGKLGVPTRILRKAGPLTPDERRAIERHPEYGHEMTRGIAFLDDARAAILHHHERLDGSGYPDGLSGEQIPCSALIVAVADAFDAMTSTRSYRPARPVPEALAELDRCAGAHFDPAAVAALTRAVRARGEGGAGEGEGVAGDSGTGGSGAAGSSGGPGAAEVSTVDGSLGAAGPPRTSGAPGAAGAHRAAELPGVDRSLGVAGAAGTTGSAGSPRSSGSAERSGTTGSLTSPGFSASCRSPVPPGFSLSAGLPASSRPPGSAGPPESAGPAKSAASSASAGLPVGAGRSGSPGPSGSATARSAGAGALAAPARPLPVVPRQSSPPTAAVSLTASAATVVGEGLCLFGVTAG